MTEQDFAKSIFERKLIAPRDWFNDLLGLIVYFMLWFLCGMPMLLDKNLLLLPLFALFGFASLFGIYALTHERELNVIETRLSAKANKRLLLLACEDLGWEITLDTENVVKAFVPGTWGFVGHTATGLIIDGALLLNVIHEGTDKGRVPFSFGYNGKKLTQLIETILKQTS